MIAAAMSRAVATRCRRQGWSRGGIERTERASGGVNGDCRADVFPSAGSAIEDIFYKERFHAIDKFHMSDAAGQHEA